ncbi:flagellin [Temperatibacter marinus]|uniref:Flagellin n=1 Tax=Temperatibacter marinus TaxID=1456591 RepID=A0AA52EHB6_9PROT|nr:flagellin [Temperatibacter marinus]WND02066.1 flagellin [Temperatibacter marinus]
MTRVSSFGQQTLLLRGMMNNQESVFKAQQQITTGKKSTDYAGTAGDTATILGAKNFKSRVETYQSSIATIRGKLDANDVQLEGMLNSMRSLKETTQTALANYQAEGLIPLLEQGFKFIVNGLNSNLDGTFLFSGAKTGTKPVNVDEISDLSSLGSISDAFENSDIGFEARIADGVELEFGLLADEIAEDAFQVMHDIYDYNVTNPGALEGELDSTSYAFIQSKISELDTVIDDMLQIQVSNGLAFERLEVVDNQHKDTVNYLETYIADLEDVDLAEAITRLNNDQVALEASYQAVSSLTQLSLLRFL